MEGQKNHLQTQDPNTSFNSHINLPLCMWNMDPHSWTGTTDPNLRNEMLQEDLWHLIQRQNHKRRRQEPSQGGHWTTRWPPLYSQDQETEMVWTCYMSNRTCKHHHAGHSTRREEMRQTKKMLTQQHQGMDGAASRQDPETSRRQRRLEKVHQNICGAPTAPQRLRAADDIIIPSLNQIHSHMSKYMPMLKFFDAVCNTAVFFLVSLNLTEK